MHTFEVKSTCQLSSTPWPQDGIIRRRDESGWVKEMESEDEKQCQRFGGPISEIACHQCHQYAMILPADMARQSHPDRSHDAVKQGASARSRWPLCWRMMMKMMMIVAVVMMTMVLMMMGSQ